MSTSSIPFDGAALDDSGAVIDEDVNQSSIVTKPLLIHRRNLYILPTRFGIVFSVMLLLMLIMALNYNNGLIFAIVFLLFSVGLISIFQTHSQLMGLQFQVGNAEPVFLGDTARFKIMVTNKAQIPRQEIILSDGLNWAQTIAVNNTMLQHFTVSIPTTSRGWLNLSRLSIACKAPMGLCRVWSVYQNKGAPIASCLVYPNPDGELELPNPTPLDNENEGATRVQEGESFVGLRNYQPGDSPKRIHWKALARGTAEIPVKMFEGEGSMEMIFNMENICSNDIEVRISQLTQWILDAEQRGFDYGLVLGRTIIEAGQGPLHQHRCLAKLALLASDAQ